MSRRATLRLLLLGLLLCWCGVFLRSENTEKSIVRALLLYNSQVIALRDDVLRTLPECREVQLADCRTSLAGTLLDSVLRLLSPLM